MSKRFLLGLMNFLFVIGSHTPTGTVSTTAKSLYSSGRRYSCCKDGVSFGRPLSFQRASQSKIVLTSAGRDFPFTQNLLRTVDPSLGHPSTSGVVPGPNVCFVSSLTTTPTLVVSVGSSELR